MNGPTTEEARMSAMADHQRRNEAAMEQGLVTYPALLNQELMDMACNRMTAERLPNSPRFTRLRLTLRLGLTVDLTSI
jgi:hypothetical protein